jgi:hypothetical protein
MNTSAAQKRYPLADWMNDLDALFSAEAMTGNIRQIVTEHFQKRYEGVPIPVENCLRLIHCLTWVRDNFQALVAVAVVDPARHKITNAANVALYLMFMDIDAARVGQPIDEGVSYLLESMKSLNDFRQSESRSGEKSP